MKLKSLKVQGFKSFADSTTVEFHDGITAVVGPNGCGKSNISDAILSSSKIAAADEVSSAPPPSGARRWKKPSFRGR